MSLSLVSFPLLSNPVTFPSLLFLIKEFTPPLFFYVFVSFVSFILYFLPKFLNIFTLSKVQLHTALIVVCLFHN